MLTAVLAFLNMIPGLSSVITNFTNKAFDAKVSLVQARIGGDRAVAEKLVTAAVAQDHENTSKLSIMAGNKVLVIMLIGFATPIMAYEWKIVIWDIVLGSWTHGTTDAIKGEVAAWATTIIGFLFGSSTIVTVGNMWFNRNKAGQ